MIRAEKKFIAPTYHFSTNGEYFGTLKASFLKPHAILIARKGNYRFYREKWDRGAYFCELEGSCLAKAEKPGGIGQDYVIQYNSISYSMKPGDLFRDKHELNFIITKDDEEFGAIYQDPSPFLLNIDMGDELPLIIQCFIFWLAYVLWVCERGWSRSVLGARLLR